MSLSVQSTYNAPYVYCEYAFHGEQSRYTCCPLGFTGHRDLPETCGCRDDLDQTPYRMGAVIAAPPSSASTTFAFNLALVETQWRQDFDGLDYDQGLAVGVGVSQWQQGQGLRGLGEAPPASHELILLVNVPCRHCGHNNACLRFEFLHLLTLECLGELHIHGDQGCQAGCLP